jgi:hypothetical protein
MSVSPKTLHDTVCGVARAVVAPAIIARVHLLTKLCGDKGLCDYGPNRAVGAGPERLVENSFDNLARSTFRQLRFREINSTRWRLVGRGEVRRTLFKEYCERLLCSSGPHARREFGQFATHGLQESQS